jgi:oxygen-independent coproporphyrinogen-3 oxidase
MLLSVVIRPQSFYAVFHELIRMAFPDDHIVFAADVRAESELCLEVCDRGEWLTVSAALGVFTRTGRATALPDKSAKSRWLRRFLYQYLSAYRGGRVSAYGILTGVRPVKVVHRMMDAGQNQAQILDALRREYLVAPEQAFKLLTVARNNRPAFVHAVGPKTIGLYVGIPFCSSRCYYCSFPGGILQDYERQIPPFLYALREEIATLGASLTDKGYQINVVYIGGGTPSVLRAEHLAEVLSWIRQAMPIRNAQEITFEAGRPDSLDTVKLRLLKDWGVNRICINPQTMRDATLARIGRKHDGAQIRTMAAEVKAYGFPRLNMDLIVGLPGESVADYRRSIEEVLRMTPENVTVHTLAVKKGSQLKADIAEKGSIQGMSDSLTRQGVALMDDLLRQRGYMPYYMYRQKYIRDNLDNTGYAAPDCACLYNILMMEERQTILGLGGGASSKFIDAFGGIAVYHNPKDPRAYQANMAGHIQAKLDKL